jgi:hypothetical protein
MVSQDESWKYFTYSSIDKNSVIPGKCNAFPGHIRILATEASAPLDDQGFFAFGLDMLVSLTECHALKLPNASMHTRKLKKKTRPCSVHIPPDVFAKQQQSSI